MKINSLGTRVLDAMRMSRDSGIRMKANSALSDRKHIKQIRTEYPRSWYSQFGEDAVIQSLLPGAIGFYIDIGSGHPVIGSNTFILHELGWTGVLVDPVPYNISLSRRMRKNDEILQAAIGSSQGAHMTVFEFDPYQYSTTSAERAEEVKSLGHRLMTTYSVKSMTLSEIVQGRTFIGPTLLSIDVEGNEMDVLASNDWETFRPDFIVVEDFVKPWLRSTPVRSFLEDKGYSLHSVCGLSSIYLLP